MMCGSRHMIPGGRTMRIQVFVLASALAVAGAVYSQTGGGTGANKGPRMPDGHPDLQGTYDIATLTTMERTAGAKPTMTMETARRLETENQQRRASANAPLAVNRTAPPVG